MERVTLDALKRAPFDALAWMARADLAEEMGDEIEARRCRRVSVLLRREEDKGPRLRFPNEFAELGRPLKAGAAGILGMLGAITETWLYLPAGPVESSRDWQAFIVREGKLLGISSHPPFLPTPERLYSRFAFHAPGRALVLCHPEHLALLSPED